MSSYIDFSQFCQFSEIHEKLFSSNFMNIFGYNYCVPSIPNFKGLGMRNLHYEIRICQNSHKKVTMTIYVWFEFL